MAKTKQTPDILNVVAAEEPAPKIKRLLLHQPFTINGVTDQALYETKGFNMTYHADGVYGEFKGFKFIVPLANIVCVYL